MRFAIEDRRASSARRGGAPPGPDHPCRITRTADLPVNSSHAHSGERGITGNATA